MAALQNARPRWLQTFFRPGADLDALQSQRDVASDHAVQIAAISRAQTVIEFNLDGTVLTANDNFAN